MKELSLPATWNLVVTLGEMKKESSQAKYSSTPAGNLLKLIAVFFAMDWNGSRSWYTSFSYGLMNETCVSLVLSNGTTSCNIV